MSSAIVNAPPPQTFMNLLHKTNRSDLVVKPQTREKMVRTFKGHITGDKLMAKRYAPLLVSSNSDRHHYMSVVLDPLIRNGPFISSRQW